jgi:hypothetical protein
MTLLVDRAQGMRPGLPARHQAVKRCPKYFELARPGSHPWVGASKVGETGIPQFLAPITALSKYAAVTFLMYVRDQGSA